MGKIALIVGALAAFAAVSTTPVLAKGGSKGVNSGVCASGAHVRDVKFCKENGGKK